MGNYGTWIWLIVMVLVFYFLIIRPQKKREKTERHVQSFFFHFRRRVVYINYSYLKASIGSSFAALLAG